MNRRFGSLRGGVPAPPLTLTLAVALALTLTLVAGCGSGNDEPGTAADDTTAAEASTTTAAGDGPFAGTTPSTTDTTDAGSGSGGGEGGSGGGDAAGTPTGSGSSEPTSPVDADTPQDLSDALGNDCADFAEVAGTQQQPGTSAEGTCEFGGEIINLYTFADADAERDFVDNGAFFDCSFIVAFGGGGSTFYVAGDGWIARPGSEEVARDLADALDGEVATYTCEAG